MRLVCLEVFITGLVGLKGFTTGLVGLKGFTTGLVGLEGFTTGLVGLKGFTTGLVGLKGFTTGLVGLKGLAGLLTKEFDTGMITAEITPGGNPGVTPIWAYGIIIAKEEDPVCSGDKIIA